MPVTVAITMRPVALWTFGEARPEAVEDVGACRAWPRSAARSTNAPGLAA